MVKKTPSKTLCNQHVLTDEVPILSLTVGAQNPHDTHWVQERQVIGGLFSDALANMPTFSPSFCLPHSLRPKYGSRYCGSALIDLAGGLCHVLSTKIRAFSRVFYLPPADPFSSSLHPSVASMARFAQFSSLRLNPSPCSSSPNSMTPHTKFPAFASILDCRVRRRCSSQMALKKNKKTKRGKDWTLYLSAILDWKIVWM